MKRTFQSLTEEELNLLSDINLSGSELSDLLNCGIVSISRWRRKLNLEIPVGCKRGVSYNRDHFKKRELRECGKKECSNTFEVIPSSRRKYCSHSCAYACCNKGKGRKPQESTAPYKKYAGKVHRLTQKIYEQHKDEINPNNLPRTICGVDNGYQLDHIIPIKFGFENNIPPDVLADKDNLRMLPWKENLMRNYLKT